LFFLRNTTSARCGQRRRRRQIRCATHDGSGYLYGG